MVKKLGAVFTWCSLLLSSPGFAHTAEVRYFWPPMVYKLQPNSPMVLENPVYWTIDAFCEIRSEDEENLVFVTAKSEYGTVIVNQTPLPKDITKEISIRNKGIIQISALSGAKVELLNPGTKTLIASCSI